MNKKVNIKFFITMASIVIILFFMGTLSLANEEYSVFVALTSNSTLKEGQIVNVNVNLTNINAGNGIDVIVAKLNYDTDVFETLTSSQFKSNTAWHITYEPSTNMLTAIKDTKVTQNETVFTIELTAKSTINVNDTTITLQDITASGGRIIDGGTDDISVNTASVKIKKSIQEVVTPPATNYSVAMSLTNNSSLIENQVVRIDANLTHVNAGNGIDVIVAKLNYNTNVFEPVTINDFSSNTGWKISYSSSTNILTAIKDVKVTQSETAFSINFKAKSKIDISSTIISLENITVSGGRILDGGTDDICVNNINVTLNKLVTVAPNSANNIDTPVEYKANSQVISAVEEVNEPIINSVENSDVIVDTDVVTTTDKTILAKMDDIDVVEEVKVTDTNMQVLECENDDFNTIERTIISSASSVSFVSICYILFKKLICGV